MTLDNGYLGSCIDEERSEMRYLWVKDDVPRASPRGWLKSKFGAESPAITVDEPTLETNRACGTPTQQTYRPHTRPLCKPSVPYTRPQVRRGYPLSLSISKSGGKETNKDSLSNGERTGKSPP
ncbi:hypothetical protein PHAVU_002G055500 [Phaseolus vulgaris]|uniref:Uncharacterized protein n=1 Tax=Phaseolus vulgaris TaxID=3885 RepID=V7CK29_PHAVU|nr:hypothetical protein PHAVU_002G055500g [Phaseolus vulgaris]ESW29251.1 hypothetical protein PHAVU_002G055500g [Phaseolus vulgaris]